jgi:L-rhamnonate dehydratase
VNAPWGEFFMTTPPGVPPAEVALFKGMAVPEHGRLVPRDDPGFGLGVTLDDLEAMKA